MAKPLSSAQREKLQAAAKFVLEELAAKRPAELVICELEKQHGATRSVSSGAYTLRVAGTVASCTWSRDTGLLENWRKNATIRLSLP